MAGMSLASKLQKLKSAHDQGLTSESEYQNARQSALNDCIDGVDSGLNGGGSDGAIVTASVVEPNMEMTSVVLGVIGKTVQLRCSYWTERGEDGRLYAADCKGRDSSTRPILMSKPDGHLTSIKGHWIVEEVPGKPEQICLRNAYWKEKGEDGRLYAADFKGRDSSTRPILMSKPHGHLTSKKCNWIVEQAPGQPGQICLRNAYWKKKGEDGRLYAANYEGINDSTRDVLMSKPNGHLTSTKGHWTVEVMVRNHGTYFKS